MYPRALEPPLQPLRLDFFFIDFPLHPCSQLPFLFSIFTGRTTEQGESHSDPMRVLRPPNFPPQTHCAPPHLPLIYCQVKLHSALPRAAGGMFLCVLQDHLFMHSPCYSFAIVSTGEGGVIE